MGLPCSSWPGAGDPERLTGLWWHDGLGWIVQVQSGDRVVHTWFAWSLRIR